MRITRNGVSSEGRIYVQPNRNPGKHDLEDLFSQLTYKTDEDRILTGSFKLKSYQAENNFRDLIRQDECASATFIFLVETQDGQTDYLHSRMKLYTSDQFEYQWTDRPSR